MRRFVWTIIGLALLVAALALIWTARGPLPHRDVTTGGVLYTQPELAALAASGSGVDAVADVQAGPGPALVPVRPDVSSAVVSDLSAIEPGELQAAPTTNQAAAGVPLTTDVVINQDTLVAIAPLGGEESALAGQGGLGATTAGYEQRVVEVEWPDSLPVGRSGAVRLTLKLLEDGALQPVAEIDDNQVLATPILITDRYDTHDAFVTATLSAPDFTVESVTNPTQPLQRGGEAAWRWTVQAGDAQSAVMSMGLAITWQPKTPDQPALTNLPIWGQAVQVDVVYVFGLLTVPQAGVVGTALAVLGFIAEVPLLERFLELLLEVLFGRGRRRRRNSRAEASRRRRR